MNIGSRFYNDKFRRRIQNHFSEKTRRSLKVSKKFLPVLEFRINLFWSLSKAWIESSGTWNIGQRLENANFGRRTEDGFSRKPRQTLELFKKFSAMLQFAINFFWSAFEISVECDFLFFKCCECRMFNCQIFNWR